MCEWSTISPLIAKGLRISSVTTTISLNLSRRNKVSCWVSLWHALSNIVVSLGSSRLPSRLKSLQLKMLES